MIKQLKYKVAVYGTLLNGLQNHSVLSQYLITGEAKLLGEDNTKELFYMYNFGYFPGIKSNGKHSIHVEVYSLGYEALTSIRYLEGYDGTNNSLFIEKKINTKYGTALIYVYNSHNNRPTPLEPDSNNIVNYKNYI